MKSFRVIAQRGRTSGRKAWQVPSARFSSTLHESAPQPPPKIPTSPCTKYSRVTHGDDLSTVSPVVQKDLDRAKSYVLPVYARPPFVLERGKGSYVWDSEGRKYLDFTAGIAVNALGHGDEGVQKVIAEQSGKLLHTSNAYYHTWAGQLAERLVTLTQKEGGLGYATGSLHPPEGITSGAKVFFSNSGTEANEGALKIARFVGKKRWAEKTGKSWDDPACDKVEIVCFDQGFHGRSMGALSVTTNPKYQKPFAPLLPGVKVGRVNEPGSVAELISEKTCAVIIEPIQGEGGVNAANVDWIRRVRERCDETGAVLIFDEIQCGLYRTGSLWAHSVWPVECHPDIVTMAKPLGNGYPVGAVLLRDSIAEPMTAGTHGTTFGGSPLACAVGDHVLSRLSERPFVANVMQTGAYLQARLSALPQWFPEILHPGVRGRGLILGLGFLDGTQPAKIVGLARERGVLFLTAGKDAVRFVPSLTVGQEEVDLAVDVLESCLSILDPK